MVEEKRPKKHITSKGKPTIKTTAAAGADRLGRRSTDQSTASSEARYRAVFETSSNGFWLCSPKGRILEVNDAYLKLSGYTRAELLTMSIPDMEARETADEIAAHLEKVISKGSDIFESVHRAKDGTIWPVEVNLSYSPIEGGLYFVHLRDISGQKQSEHKYRCLVEMTDTGYVILDSQGRVLDANQKYIDLTGRTNREDVIGHSVLEWTAAYDQERNAAEVRKCIAHGSVRNLRIDYIGHDNRIRPIEIDATVLDSEESFKILSLCRDITERKRIEEALRASERFLQTIIDAEPECVKLLDENANLIMMNRAGLDMIQADSLEQVKGQCVCPLITYDYCQPFLDLTKRVFQGESGILLFEIIGMKGRRLWLETHAVPLRNEKDEIFALLGVTRDVTGRREAEEKLRQSEKFVRGILDTVDEGFIVVDRDYKILIANKAYCRQVGKSSDEIIGSHCYVMSHQTSRPCFEEGEECATRHAFQTGMPHTALHRHKDANGAILYVETKAFPIKDDTGKVTSVIETINNITEKFLLEEERLKTQKLESIGTLAGGIAHDFNNLLQGIFGYISMAKLTHDQKEKSLAMLDQAEEALHMSVNLTTQLLTFSKGGKPVMKLVRLEPTVENAVKFALSGSQTDYQLNIAPDLWPVEADAGQLAQVIQNIALNANESMAGRGTVSVSVRNTDIPPKTNPRLLKGGEFVRIDIQDKGTGISEQNLPRIFDPYFTTKQRGSGLGLATSYSIIKNHGGLIEVSSVLNRGTTFSIYLPASRGAEITAAATVPAEARNMKCRILLMDDEDLVRHVALEMIAALGHDVESAEDGTMAVELFREAKKTGRPFDLVILDLTVKGGMGGEEALAKIREIDPEVKAVVSSGYADSPIVADYRTYGFSAVLNKPYRIDSLEDCLGIFIC